MWDFVFGMGVCFYSAPLDTLAIFNRVTACLQNLEMSWKPPKMSGNYQEENLVRGKLCAVDFMFWVNLLASYSLLFSTVRLPAHYTALLRYYILMFIHDKGNCNTAQYVTKCQPGNFTALESGHRCLRKALYIRE